MEKRQKRRNKKTRKKNEGRTDEKKGQANAVIRIRDILVRIWIRGSDLRLRDSDPALSSVTFRTPTKNNYKRKQK